MVLLALVALEIPLALSLRDRVDAEVRGQARSQADVLAATAAELVDPPARRELRRLADSASSSVRGRVIIVNARGRVLADSANPAFAGRNYTARPEIAAALGGRSFQRSRLSATLGEEILATAVPVLKNGRPAGAVRVTQSVKAVGRAVRRAVVGLVLVGGVVLVLGLAAGALIAAQVARPIRRLDRAARQVAEGDLEARATVEGSTEQRSLARTFNDMTERIGRLLRSHQDFVADASHQLRTPLTSLRLHLEEARASTGKQDADEQLNAATREVDRLAEMVEELLVLTRAGERELPGGRLDLDRVAGRAVERWRAPAAEAGIELATGGRDGGAVWCARSDVDRALDALMENALRYAPAGTTVEVRTRPGAVEVCDRGPGLEPGEEEAVFERFHRGRAGRQGPPGTGLGLPIARELAREWGGTVTISNRERGGARATVTLPNL